MRKRKERERGERVGSEGGVGIGNGEAQEDLLAQFRADAEFSEEDSGGEMEERVEGEEKRRPKKWFEEGSDEEVRSKKRNKAMGSRGMDKPPTLEDLEALAAGLLD